MSNLQHDEYYYMFIQDLAAELCAEARQAFAHIQVDERHKPHAMNDLLQAMQANERAKNAGP